MSIDSLMSLLFTMRFISALIFLICFLATMIISPKRMSKIFNICSILVFVFGVITIIFNVIILIKLRGLPV